MKQAIARVEKTSAKGAKVIVAGRLNGVEIARTETLSSGSLPLHTLRADIDYAFTIAQTTYGVLGVKVWIYKGERFKKDNQDRYAAFCRCPHGRDAFHSQFDRPWRSFLEIRQASLP